MADGMTGQGKTPSHKSITRFNGFKDAPLTYHCEGKDMKVYPDMSGGRKHGTKKSKK